MAADVKTMEVKKTQQLTSDVSRDTTVSTKKAKSFLADVKLEITKISWTTPEELRTYTKIVVIATFAMGIGVYMIDVFIQLFLGTLEGIIRMIGG